MGVIIRQNNCFDQLENTMLSFYTLLKICVTLTIAYARINHSLSKSEL